MYQAVSSDSETGREGGGGLEHSTFNVALPNCFRCDGRCLGLDSDRGRVGCQIRGSQRAEATVVGRGFTRTRRGGRPDGGV